jgi:hypothetical protein
MQDGVGWGGIGRGREEGGSRLLVNMGRKREEDGEEREVVVRFVA